MRNDEVLASTQTFDAIPNAIIDAADDADGYIQISVQSDGMIHVRGSRHAVAQFVEELRAQGIQIHFDSLHWCG